MSGKVSKSELEECVERWREAAKWAEDAGYWKEADGINSCADEIEALIEDE